MEPILHRKVLYTKDIMRITGRSERWCRKLLAGIRIKNNKESNAFVTIEEFCAHTGIPEYAVKPFVV